MPQEHGDAFSLSQDIAPLPAACEAAIYEEILKLNLPAQATRGGALAFDGQTRTLVFTYSRDIGVTDLRQFCAVLENFFDAAEAIRQRVKKLFSLPGPDARSRHSAQRALLNKLSLHTTPQS